MPAVCQGTNCTYGCKEEVNAAVCFCKIGQELIAPDNIDCQGKCETDNNCMVKKLVYNLRPASRCKQLITMHFKH